MFVMNPKGIHTKCNNVSIIPIIHPFRTIFVESGWSSSFSTNHIIALPIIPKKIGARYQAADGLSDIIDSQNYFFFQEGNPPSRFTALKPELFNSSAAIPPRRPLAQ